MGMKTAKRPRPHPEMVEGPEAFKRFQEAMKAILKVPKSAMPPSPFSRHQKQEPKAPQG
jgi:hypothetical protein